MLRRLFGRRLRRRPAAAFESYAAALGREEGEEALPSIVILNLLSHDQLLSLLEVRVDWLVWDSYLAFMYLGPYNQLISLLEAHAYSLFSTFEPYVLIPQITGYSGADPSPRP